MCGARLSPRTGRFLSYLTSFDGCFRLGRSQDVLAGDWSGREHVMIFRFEIIGSSFESEGKLEL